MLPLLIHGDAAFAGQGVVAECFALSGLRGYRTGGTMHFIINNQIGFTTAPHYSRSSPYPSDVALMVQAPIFHVNGDDPEAVVFAAKVATEYRQLFGKDVVIDMFCYRRFGHNEGDDPTMTQPIMYRAMKDQPTTLDIYAERLIGEGVVTQAEVDEWQNDFNAFLDREFDAGKDYRVNKADWLDGVWSGFKPPHDDDDRAAARPASLAKLKEIGAAITEIPADFDMHKTVQRVLETRRKAIENGAGHRLGARRAARVRHAAATKASTSACPARTPPRHVQPAPLALHRSADRRALHAAQPHPRRPGALRSHQLAALRRSRARLRVRLHARRSEHADALGSAVRRLRERRAGGHRPVHLLRRAQMAAHVRPRHAVAARL